MASSLQALLSSVSHSLSSLSLPTSISLDTLRQPHVTRSTQAAVVALLLACLLLSACFFLLPPPLAKERQCTCRETADAKSELTQLKANVSEEDLRMSLSYNAPLGSVQRMLAHQRQLILDQAAAITRLRQIARAKDLRYTRDEMESHKYSVNIVEEDEPALWQQRTFRKHAAFGFVTFSAYRISPAVIVVVGLGHFLSRGERRVAECRWVMDEERKIEGTLGLESMEEHHRYLYELLIMNCTLPWDQVKQEASGIPKAYRSRDAGYLEVKLDQEVFYPYRETEGYEIHAENSDGPFPYQTLFCGPPMFGDFSIPSLTQWISYHRYHTGMDHFILYDAGSINRNFRNVLEPLVADGIVTIQDFKEALQYDIWAQNQALAMHDCLFRSRDIARWIFFHDLDEYLEVPPPLTLPALLKKYADKPYITHGCYIYSVDNCEEMNVWDPERGKFAVELMLYRWEKPYCTSGDYEPNMCLNYHGHRKMIQNPRKVLRTYVHIPEIPEAGGVDLPIGDMRHAHYRGLFHPSRACQEAPQKADDLKPVDSVALIAANARACAQNGFTDQKVCAPGF